MAGRGNTPVNSPLYEKLNKGDHDEKTTNEIYYFYNYMDNNNVFDIRVNSGHDSFIRRLVGAKEDFNNVFFNNYDVVSTDKARFSNHVNTRT